PRHALESQDRREVGGHGGRLDGAVPLGAEHVDEELPGTADELEHDLEAAELLVDHLRVHGGCDGGPPREVGPGAPGPRWDLAAGRQGRPPLGLEDRQPEHECLDAVHVQQELLRPRLADTLQTHERPVVRPDEAQGELVAEATEVRARYQLADLGHERVDRPVHRADVRRLLPHLVERPPVRPGHVPHRPVEPLLESRHQHPDAPRRHVLERPLLLPHVDPLPVRRSDPVPYQVLERLDRLGAVLARVYDVADRHLPPGGDAVDRRRVRTRRPPRRRSRHLGHDVRRPRLGRGELPLQHRGVRPQLLLERPLEEEERPLPRQGRAPRDAVLHVDEQARARDEDRALAPGVDPVVAGGLVETLVHAPLLEGDVGGHVVVEGRRGESREGRDGTPRRRAGRRGHAREGIAAAALHRGTAADSPRPSSSSRT
ncbi:hypothetical protein THAOC_18737, partial [Thalassiosira oceanica]